MTLYYFWLGYEAEAFHGAEAFSWFMSGLTDD
jgi:hypothetical protein